MTIPNHADLAHLSNQLDGQMTAHDDLVKAEQANVAAIEKALQEANERLSKYQADRREVALQFRAVADLLHRAEDAERYDQRNALVERIEKFT
jgi:hypothetical protein